MLPNSAVVHMSNQALRKSRDLALFDSSKKSWRGIEFPSLGTVT